MTNAEWHRNFNPRNFLSKVDLPSLLERNQAYNEAAIANARGPCILCSVHNGGGILLNDKSFLCQGCYSEIALISYPERYELARRHFLTARAAHGLAWESLRTQFEFRAGSNLLVFLGWFSLLFAFAMPAVLVLTAALLLLGYAKVSGDKRREAQWLDRKDAWEREHAPPAEPVLRHFHDPAAELSARDHVVLKVFNNWPGYPPFWKYLRDVVLARDGRCQVAGCPSRLSLHAHHKMSVAEGGMHTPENLVLLCDFHHALEPEKGHERIWGRDIKTQFFTLVSAHERSNRASSRTHSVRAHLRRLQLVTGAELATIADTYGFSCPSCGAEALTIDIDTAKNMVHVLCTNCHHETQGPQQLTEETGPRLAEILKTTRARGSWPARWDMLEERTSSWGCWARENIATKRQAHKAKVESKDNAPTCPRCGAPMRVVRPRPGNSWEAFWGCTKFRLTDCKGSARYRP